MKLLRRTSLQELQYAKIMGLGTIENRQGKSATAAKISKRWRG